MGHPLYVSTQPVGQPEGGDGRHTSSDKREPEPRVPIIGLNAGCTPGTNPGCSARELERAGRDIVRSRMLQARNKLKQGKPRPL